MRFVRGLIALAVAPLLGWAAGFSNHYFALGTQDQSIAVSADAAGDVFVVSAIAASRSVRVTKAEPGGRVVAVLDFAAGVTPSGGAVDAAGNVLVVAPGLVAKIDNLLSGVIASSTVGGTAVTSDLAGNVWVAGTEAGMGFVKELSPDLSQVIASTVFGGTVADCNPVSANCRGPNGAGLPAATTPAAIALNGAGSVFVAGVTNGTPAKLGVAPYNYAFVMRFSPDLSTTEAQFSYNPAQDTATSFRSMAVDASGGVVLVGGSAYAGTLPGSGPGLQLDSPASGGGLVIKLDWDLNYVWGTYFGAPANRDLGGVALDAAGQIWITGNSPVSQLPGSGSTDSTDSPFVAELAADGSAVLGLTVSPFGGLAITGLAAGGVAVLGPSDAFLLPGNALLTVANSANNRSSGTIAPTELISLFGPGIGPSEAVGGVVMDGAFSTALAGYQVLFNGVPAPLLYAGPDQMNVVAPVSIAGQGSVDIEVVGPDRGAWFPTVFVEAARPQLFTESRVYPVPFTNATEVRSFAIAFNADGSLNTALNAAARGSVVTIWVSGAGLTSGVVADGSVGTGASELAVALGMGGLEVLYAGQAPGAVQGLTQVNFRVPSDLFVFGPTLWGVGVAQGGEVSDNAVIGVTK